MNDPTATEATELLERLVTAIRDAACDGRCSQTEEECARERIQPFVWHHGRLAVVEGSPEMFANAVLPVVGRLEAEVAAARAFAAEMRNFCSPHGVAVDYAERLIEAMDRAKEGRP
ncbi:hypothetical protein [Streptomyces glaucescens]|jgi:hypothetical protein|uniref:hypothetical protein n=1 Tax=Streptomyces glaucescens TaxID=1907 RepID=UPI000A3A437C|nr:hypothetical protein [Streptomyces glaucescens]